MSEKSGQDAVEEAAPEVEAQASPAGNPLLNQAYVPAQEDSIVAIRFVGNTAQIGDFQTKNIDAFQLLALGSFLDMKGKQTIAAIEAEAMARAQAAQREQEIVVPTRMPTEEELRNMPEGMRPANLN